MSRFIVIALVLASLVSLSSAQKNCSYGSPDYFVPFYDSARTTVNNTIYFTVGYNAAAFVATPSFDGANSSCGFVASFLNADGINSCNSSVSIELPINATQFENCGFAAASSTEYVRYTARFKLTTIEQAGVLRRVTFNRTIESAILLSVQFATVVNATSGNVSIYSAVAAQAVITQQLFDTTTYSSNLQLTTSVQYPYVLTNGSALVSFNDAYYTMTVNPDSINGNCSTNVALNGSCFQVFNLTITTLSACVNDSTPKNLNHNWNISFIANCDTTRINCSNYTAQYVYVAFRTESPDFCPIVLGTITPTMTVVAYDGDNLIPQTFFVWGARSYFRVVVSSPVAVDKVAMTRVYLATGGTNLTNGIAAEYSSLYQRVYPTEAGAFGSVAAAVAAFWNANATDADASNAYVRQEFKIVDYTNFVTNIPSLVPYVYFTINWGSLISNATGDNPLDTTVAVEARIKYTGSTGSAERIITQKINALDAAQPTSMGARAQVGVVQADSTPVSTAARSSSSSNLAIIAVASVGGAIAVLSVFAIVAIKRRRNSKEQQEKMESVYLSRLETPASTTA